MKSYQYFIELLIAGAGAFIWILILSIDVFGIEWFVFEYQVLQEMSDGILFGVILLLFPFFFVSGIITDRVSDFAFDKIYNIKEARKHFTARGEYQKIKAKIFMRSSDLRELYEYGRMRSRICRDWTLNSVLILLAFNYLLWFGDVFAENRLKICLFTSGLLISSTFIAFMTWRNLIRKEYRFIKMARELLQEENSTNLR